MNTHNHFHQPGKYTVNVTVPGLEQLVILGEKIMLDVSNLVREVEETRGAVDSAIALINGLKQQLIDAAGDQAKIDEIVATLDAEGAKLAEAVAANS